VALIAALDQGLVVSEAASGGTADEEKSSDAHGSSPGVREKSDNARETPAKYRQ
jgi:hypothetical protein